MYKVSEVIAEDNKSYEVVNTITKYKKINTAILNCMQLAKDFKSDNDNIKLLDYERTYKSETLVYGVYCIDKNTNKLIKEYRVYEI